VWGLAAALYLIAFYQRVAPAVMTGELSRDFGLSAASLGNLSAFYFYGYVAVQIPTGLLADRWGPRKVLTAGAALTAAGTLLFALAPSPGFANAGRLAIGAAAGVAFVAMMKLATHWMPARQFAFATALALFIGTLGATMAGAPLRVAVDAFGWRGVMVASAIGTAGVALALWTVVRDDPVERGYASYFATDRRGAGAPSIASQLREVFGYRNTWMMLVVPGSLSGIVLAFAGLWGVPFLVSQYAFPPRAAAVVASAMLIVWAIVVLVPGLGDAALVAILMGVAFASGAAMLTFPFAKESVPAHLAGTVGGITNMGMMLGGMLTQPLVGLVLDRYWAGAFAGGARAYDFAAYQRGFALMLAWSVLALVALAFVRERREGRASSS
jgi:sugar phosphate permease